MTQPGTQPADKRLLTEAAGNATYAPVSRALPTGGSTGQVPVKTASGVAWQDAPSGGGGVQSPNIGKMILVEEGAPLPTLEDGDVVLRYAPPVIPGATYFTDFSADTAGAAPAGWSRPWVQSDWLVQSVAGATGGKAVVVSPSANGRNALTWDAINADVDRANVEILVRWQSASQGTSLLPIARASGALAAESCYRGGVFDATSYTAAKYVAGTNATLGTTTTNATLANTWNLTRLRVNGDKVQVKHWQDGTTEPTAWGVDLTDTSLTAAGAVGVATTTGGAKTLDWVAVATGGRTAVKP